MAKAALFDEITCASGEYLLKYKLASSILVDFLIYKMKYLRDKNTSAQANAIRYLSASHKSI